MYNELDTPSSLNLGRICGVAISRLRVSLDHNPNRNRNPNRMLTIGIADYD